LFRLALTAAIAFVAANPDELFVLAGFFSTPKASSRRIILGQYVGAGFLIVTSLFGSLLALIIPKGYLRILGLLPLLIGLKDLSSHYGNGQKAERSGRSVIEVAAVAISCGTDNIAVYIPLFAGRHHREVGLILAVFGAMVGLWCATAHWLVHHRKIGHVVKYWAPKFLPWILIILGLAILLGLERIP
jgi:cadmium resistance protein CadD (predicted permease)